jgi:tetratricopeptide (TPR) repeat protein
MHGSSLEIDTILATLAAAEAQVRWLMAEALTPAAAYRVESASTARARSAEASLGLNPQRLTGNWGEFIELEPGFEQAILASLPAEPPIAVAMRAVAVGHAPPPLPADFPADGTGAWEAPDAASTAAWAAADQAHAHAQALAEASHAWETAVETPEDTGSGEVWTEEQQAAWDAWQAQQAAAGFDESGSTWQTDPAPDPASEPAPEAWPAPEAEADVAPEHGEETYADHLWRAEADPWSPAATPAAWEAPAPAALSPTPDADRPDTMLEAALETTRAELTVELPRATENDDPSHESTHVSFAGQDDDGPLALDDAADDPSLVSIAQATQKPQRVDSVRLRREAPAPAAAPAAVGPAALASGAPTLDDKAVQALFVRAHDTARQSVAEAVALYGDVLDAQPEHVGARLARGRLLLDLGDYVAAASDLQRAEAAAVERPDLHTALGDLFFARKDYRRAQGHYDTALGLDGSHAHALYKRGLGKYYRKEFPEAVEDLERAKKLDAGLPGLDNFLDRARRKQA